MAEKIDPTWLAYMFRQPVSAEGIEAGLSRVREHYGRHVSYPLTIRGQLCQTLGIALLTEEEPRCAWPHFARSDGITLATAYPPTRWELLTGRLSAQDAALSFGRAVLARPERVASLLTAPALLGVLDEEDDRLVIANDAIGGARLYVTTFQNGFVWSNRAAAGCLFAGAPIEADDRGWRLLAAGGWFFGDSTPIRGVHKVPRGTVIEARPDGVELQDTRAVGTMVSGADDLEAALDSAATAAVGQVKTAATLWENRPVVHLSGGRDSRLVAAAAAAGNVDVVLRTSDNSPGEADVARQLVALAPRPMEHVVVRAEEGEGPTLPLTERAGNAILLHDGVRQASKIRFDVVLPRAAPDRATLPGFGGEVAHAFYYHFQDRTQLRKVRWLGRWAVPRQLRESLRRKNEAAHETAYELAEQEYSARIREGLQLNLRGPDLLDWFYLTERFVHRFELGADSQCVSVYGTPEFIRAAYAARPTQRMRAEPHREIIARLMPAWARVPFYKPPSGPRPTLRRQRLWESERDAATVEEMIAGGGAWTELFRPDAIKEMWREARSGRGFADWETVFERLVCRVAFDGFIELTTDHARRGKRLFD